MRKYDVFGKKVARSSILIWIGVLFVFILPFHFWIAPLHASQVEEIEQERAWIQAQINAYLSRGEVETYHAVSDIIHHLPNAFSESHTALELRMLRDASGLADAPGYSVSFTRDASSPFDKTLPSSVKFVSISLSVTAPDVDTVFTFIDNIQSQPTIYYVRNLNLSITGTGETIAQMTLFTFYNDVQISSVQRDETWLSIP